MDIKCRDIAKLIEGFAPVNLAQSWDNVGLQIGSYNKEVKRIMICLTVTSEIVNSAINNNVDLIISHHPILLKGINSICSDDLRGDIIYKLIKNDISVYISHTNMDITDGGVNDCLAEVLDLVNVKNINQCKMELNGKSYGLGKIGLLNSPQHFKSFINTVKRKLDIETLRYIGDINRVVRKAAVFCGSFDGNLSSIVKENADVLITGDIKFHTAVDAEELGLCVIDAGHFKTEILIVPRIKQLILKEFSNIMIIDNKKEHDPFKFI